MYPEIFHLSFLHTYGVLVALAFLTALWMAGKLARRAGLNVDAVTNLGIYCALSAIVGAKLMMFLVDFTYYREHPARDLLALLAAGRRRVLRRTDRGAGRLVVVHAPHASAAAGPLPTSSRPAIALGHGIGRLGCFSAGCCWGIECHLPWAVTFTNPAAHDLVGVPLDVPLHPTQLYESFAEFIIFAILYWRFASAHAPGAIISLYLMLYSTARFIVEFFRYHEQGNLWGGPLDTSQWISIVLFLLGASYFLFQRQRVAAHAV